MIELSITSSDDKFQKIKLLYVLDYNKIKEIKINIEEIFSNYSNHLNTNNTNDLNDTNTNNTNDLNDTNTNNTNNLNDNNFISSLILTSSNTKEFQKVKKVIINELNKILLKCDLKSLETVNITRFNLDKIPSFINKCINLKNLNLSKNKINQIPCSLPNSILNLNLSDNYISEVKILPNNILTLSLDNNRIKYFDLNFNNRKNKYKLIYLSLMNNNLYSYRFLVIDNSLKTLNLSFNKNLSSNIFYLGRNISNLDIDYTNIKYISNRSPNLHLIDNIDYLLGKKNYRAPTDEDFKLIRYCDKINYREYKYDSNIPLYIENHIY
jgi:hypothetical protein